MDYFQGGLDYIYFIRGFCLLLAAIAAFFLRRDKPGALAWRWLALAAAAGAASELSAILAGSLFQNGPLSWFRLALLALHFGLLAEFGRRSSFDVTGRAPGAWIYLPAALLSAYGARFGLAGLETSLLLFGALPACLYSGYAVLSAGKGLPAKIGAPIKLLGWLLLFYGPLSLLCAPAGLPPLPESFGRAAFFNLAGFPAQLPVALLLAACVGALWHTAFSVWSYSAGLHASVQEGQDLSFGSAVRWMPLVTVEIMLLVVLAMGWYGTSGLGMAERTALVRESRNNASILYFRMNEKLTGIGQTAVMLAESHAVQKYLAAGTVSLATVDAVLDRFKRVHEADVCYLMDKKGKVLSSSNRAEPVSFVGDNYSFRPYFQEALAGANSRYFALGTTTKLRGYYASAPVADASGKPIGVAAIKKNLDFLEEEMKLMPYAFFVSPEGVVFLSGREEQLFKSLWTVKPEARYELLRSNQFGALDFDPVWKAPPVDGDLVELEGELFYVARLLFGGGGWSLLTLSPTRTVLVTRFYGIAISFVLCLLTIGISVILAQYRMRREEEVELMRVREERRVLIGLLPICSACRKVRDDRDYRARVEAYVNSHIKVSSAHGLCPDCARKAPPGGAA